MMVAGKTDDNMDMDRKLLWGMLMMGESRMDFAPDLVVVILREGFMREGTRIIILKDMGRRYMRMDVKSEAAGIKAHKFFSNRRNSF